ncbi:M15 family metallopeptidase [Clostridium sp. D33t1_170424_F3]|uniref:M15 family metallopeptidase n=1 Tax=Clostridium sp. D33t1_170424_F3 TaxID=2787099 RepID=UPI0018A93D8A|nr:M15 family metallopeptidase [Clostridium sp. D33t1_170424_F3]
MYSFKQFLLVAMALSFPMLSTAPFFKQSSDSAPPADMPYHETARYDQPEADPYAACLHYLESNRADYLAYQQKHPELEAWDVVTQVNIGLNRPFYTDIQTVADPDSLLVLCNKYWKLPDGYAPADLRSLSPSLAAGSANQMRREAADAFEALCADAGAAGYTIRAQSAYRSYSTQKSLYARYAARDGAAGADIYSARAGHSDHQTGLVVDVKNATQPYNRFGQTAEYQWAKDNIHKYGFIIHYPEGSQPITGYKTEEWHWRYVGKEAAAAIYNFGITLDEYCAIFLTGNTAGTPSLTSDTPEQISVKAGDTYTFLLKPQGALQVPTFTTGNGEVLATCGLHYSGGNYYVSVRGVAPGSTNVYASFPGQAPVRCCSVTVS